MFDISVCTLGYELQLLELLIRLIYRVNMWICVVLGVFRIQTLFMFYICFEILMKQVGLRNGNYKWMAGIRNAVTSGTLGCSLFVVYLNESFNIPEIHFHKNTKFPRFLISTSFDPSFFSLKNDFTSNDLKNKYFGWTPAHISVS